MILHRSSTGSTKRSTISTSAASSRSRRRRRSGSYKTAIRSSSKRSRAAFTKTTNDLLTTNSQLLKEGTIEIAKESERGIVEIETLKRVNVDLISTIEETIKIQADGSAKRRQAEGELVRLENDLKDKLLSLKS